jgi:hypothetical protein
LENLRDYPRDMADVLFDELSDGVVSGFKPIISENTFTISKGVAKYQGGIYLMNSQETLEYGETDNEVLVKLRFGEELQDGDFKTRNAEISIDRSLKILPNEIELFRFKLKKGAYLRDDYQDLDDFTTEYNTVNIVNVPRAGRGEATIAGAVTRYFAEQALKTTVRDAVDINFCMLCLNSEKVEKSAICAYICYKLNEFETTFTNAEIHIKLTRILRAIKRENQGRKRERTEHRRIVVD